MVERSFALILDRGGMRRAWLRGRENVHKRYLIHVAGYNLGLIMRLLTGAGTPRELAARASAWAWRHPDAGWRAHCRSPGDGRGSDCRPRRPYPGRPVRLNADFVNGLLVVLRRDVLSVPIDPALGATLRHADPAADSVWPFALELSLY